MSLAVELHQAHKARLERIAMAAERHLASKKIVLLEQPKPEPAQEPIPEPEPIDDGWIEQEPAKLDAEAEPPPIYQPPIRTIQQATCDIYGVTLIDLLSSRRTANVVRPRQVAMYLAKTLTLRSLPEIGRRFGGRDHTTVLHAVRKITQLIQTDSNLADKIASIKEHLNGLD